ncbi:hypothetical protein ACFRMN_29465 [Streptomyces sp. NPDC056835]|uniref:hypothetical protein n=1 Tax=Streptomyces sp. NPDC056835 TaxID=3345956 RepID=UPI0036C836D9
MTPHLRSKHFRAGATACLTTLTVLTAFTALTALFAAPVAPPASTDSWAPHQ